MNPNAILSVGCVIHGLDDGKRPWNIIIRQLITPVLETALSYKCKKQLFLTLFYFITVNTRQDCIYTF